MKEYIGTYPGIPVTIENNGDVTFHCGSIEKAYKFVGLLPQFEITRKQYKCKNCNKDFVAEKEGR